MQHFSKHQTVGLIKDFVYIQNPKFYCMIHFIPSLKFANTGTKDTQRKIIMLIKILFLRIKEKQSFLENS